MCRVLTLRTITVTAVVACGATTTAVLARTHVACGAAVCRLFSHMVGEVEPKTANAARGTTTDSLRYARNDPGRVIMLLYRVNTADSLLT